jgi:hypothetical protein
LQFVHAHATRDVTKNLDVDDAVVAIDALIGAAFAHAHLQTTREAIELRVSRKGRAGMSRHKLASAVAAEVADEGAAEVTSAHDRAKRRFVDIGRPWLVDLGITDAEGRLVPSMARKWKQINKFVEVMSHALESAGFGAGAPLNIVDFGAGKGYLTFALHDYLRRQAAGAPRMLDIVGVELRPDLVALCNDAIARCRLDGLRFEAGDVSSFVPQRLDVMIALHACDTATDHALHTGIRAGAAIIMCSPCCHKQIRPQMQMPPLLKPMLQHGIHLGQQAEMVTDGLRALLLEAHGYDAQVFEFVALEHTSKNKMILAVKKTGAAAVAAVARKPEVLAQIAEIKRFYGIREQALESLLLSAA